MSLKQKTKNFLFILFYLAKHPRRFYNALSSRGKKWALRSLITLLIIGIAVPISFWYQAKHAKAAWWDDNWAYRIAIPVTNNTTQETNVYISVTVDTTDTSKFQADCGDIRFTKLHGELLPYYIVSDCGTDHTVIHVNFDVFPAGAQTIYMYYGNPSAPNGFSASDFTNPASNYTVGSLGSEEVGPGPIAYWKFDEGQGSTAYNSTSQTGINGTLQNSPTWKQESDCVGGKCLEYNGTTQYVSVDDTGTALDFVNTNQYTWSAWINYSGFPAGQTYQCFLSKDPPIVPKTTGFNLCLNQTGSTADIVIGKDITYSSGLSLALQANTWIHVEIEYDGASNWKTYINGVYKGSQSFAVTSDTTYKYFIGAGCGNTINGLQQPDRYFKGKIDSVKIFPYQRSADQVKQDYNSGKSGADTSEGTEWSVGKSLQWMTNGLVGHWKMDETSGTTVADASGNGNTGTLTNAQETGTAEAASTETTIVDSDNAALSSTDDAYNGMILRITSVPSCGIIAYGTERTISDFTGSSKTFTVGSAFAAGEEADSCTFEVRHQTGGKFGNGLAFGGDNDYVDASYSSVLNPSVFAISAWAYAKGGAGTNRTIISGQFGSTGYYLRASNSNTWQIVLNTGSGWLVTGNSAVTLNTWTHVIATYDGTKVKIFINGNLNQEASCTFSPNTTASTKIGAAVGPSDYYNGLLDDVRIYNRALSPDEVKQLSEYGPGPVGWWKMDENVSGNNQTLYDSSGNGNNLTTHYGANATGMDCTKNGKYNGACQIDGTDDYADISNGGSITYNNSFSISLWLKANSFSTPDAPELFYQRVQNSSGGIGWVALRVNYTDQLNFYIRGVAGDTNVTSSAISTGSWYHVEAVYDKSGTAYLYVNGTKAGSTAIASGDLIKNGNLDIARAFNYFCWNGLVDDVRIYNYARTGKQVVEDMNAGHPVGGSPVGSPVAYWKMDEGYSGTSQDASQNNQDLTLSYGSGGSVPTWTNSGKFGRALDFEKDNKSLAYTADSSALSITSDLTISAWIKPESTDAASVFDIAGKWDGASVSYLFAQVGSELRFYVDAGANYKTTSGLGLVTGTWYYVIATYSASAQTVSLYVNGVDKGGSVTGTIPTSIGDDAGRFQIGAQDSSGTAANFFDGLIDEVKVYNSALTPEQIKLDMNQGKELQLGGQVSATGATGQAAEYCVPGDSTSCAGPVGEWKFDEKTGTTANSTGTNGLAGTLYNSPSWSRGQYGSAVAFNQTDTNDYFRAADSSDWDLTGKSATLEWWMKAATSQSATYPTLLDHWDGSAGWYSLISPSTGYITFNHSGTNAVSLTTSSDYRDNAWHHVTVVLDNSTSNSYLYVDGILKNSDGFSSLTDADGYLQMAAKNGTSTFAYKGLIDNARIFLYARTPAQIAWDYNRGKPVGWWKMDEGEGTTAYDSSGNNQDLLTWASPTWVDGKFGKALDFERDSSQSASYSHDTAALSITSDLTMSAWIKPESVASSTLYDIAGKWSVGIESYLFSLYGSELRMYIDSAANYKTTSGLGLQAGQWYHVAGVYNATAQTVTLYVNGMDKGGSVTGTIPASIGDDIAWFYIGDPPQVGPGNYFDGLIDDVRVYNYALTQEQIKQVYNNGSVVKFGE